MQTIDFKHLKLSEGDTVLDLGCGQGRHTLFAGHFTQAGLAIGMDINPVEAKIAQQKDRDFLASVDKPKNHTSKTQYLAGSGHKLPFADNSFDVVICSEVLEHIHDYQAVLSEIGRVLKPAGHLALSVPRRWPERICWALSEAYHQVEGGHVRIFKESELRDRVTALNFTFVTRHWAHALHSPYWWLKCAFWQSQEKSKIIALYHRFLVWDLMKKPWLSRTLERCCNPFFGKSVVLYFTKKAP